MFPESGLIIACVSGGADSMCLLEALTEISRRYGFSVAAAHFNHKLRGEESDRDEAFVKNHCDSRGLPFFSGCGDVRARAKSHGQGVEGAARDMRYEFFRKTAAQAGAVRVATAHTADDNTETMILNLTRGTGTAGLGGIPPKRDLASASGESPGYPPVLLIRPMLRVSKAEALDYLNSRGVPFVEDSTNESLHFTRNRIRHTVIPVLKGVNPRLDDTAAGAAALARADEEYLSGLACEFIAKRCVNGAADAKELLGLPAAISGRAVRKLYGGNLSHSHVGAVLELCRSGKTSASLSLPGGTVRREYGRIVFGAPTAAADGIEPVDIAADGSGGSAVISGTNLKVLYKTVIYSGKVNKSLYSFLFKSLDICGKMTVRSRQTGDIIKLAGLNGTKSLKKLFIERRIPKTLRAFVPVVSDEKGVLAVCGLGAGDRAAPQAGDIAIQLDFTDAGPPVMAPGVEY